MTNAVHLRSAIMRAEAVNGARQHSKRAPTENTAGTSKASGASSAEQSQKRSFAIEDGEALESAVADSELLGARHLDDMQTPPRPQQPPDAAQYPLRPGLEPLDAELYETELSSLDGAASQPPATPGTQPVQLQQPGLPQNSTAMSSAVSSGSYRAAPPSMRMSMSSQSATSSAASSSRPEYRPRSALSLARRRMLAKYLPFQWQQVLLSLHITAPY